MEGIVLGIDAANRKAAVKTSNGTRRYFLMNDWKGEISPNVGTNVDFDIDEAGMAVNVFPIKSLSQIFKLENASNTQGVILGVDTVANRAALKASDGSRKYFLLSEWRGALPPANEVKIDYEAGPDGTVTDVYPLSASQMPQSIPKPEKTKTAATLFALFLGALGGHKFYLGSWGWGVVYLIFFWTYIPLLLAIAELIRYITLSDAAFQEKYAQLDEGAFSFLW